MSIPLRQALGRLSLPALIAMAFGVMLLGKADALLVERMRTMVTDVVTPIWSVLQQPVSAVSDAVTETRTLWNMRAENQRLREENDHLRRWQDTAMALEAENSLLRRQLAWVPEPAPSFFPARVVADGGGTYARAVLLATGPRAPVRKGQIALDERGFVGRVTEVGSRSARVLLATDINSRIPVTFEGTRARAIMVGNNSSRPRLQHWPEGQVPRNGDRVVTSSEASAYPAGLPVGIVRWTDGGVPEVELFARLDRLDVVRLFDFGLQGILPPEAVARPEPRPGRR